MTFDLTSFEKEEYCHLTIYSHETEKAYDSQAWFVIYNNSFYLLADSKLKTEWAKNLNKEPMATIRINEHVFPVIANLTTNSQIDYRIYKLIEEKYMVNDTNLAAELQPQKTLVIKFDLEPNFSSTKPVSPPNIIRASLITYLVILCVALVINSPLQPGTLGRASNSMIFIGTLTFLISLLVMLRFGTSSFGRRMVIDGNNARHNEWNKNQQRNEVTFTALCIGGLLAIFTGYLLFFLY